jgi:hypothetical protein
MFPVVIGRDGGESMYRDPTQATLNALINILGQKRILSPADMQRLQNAAFLGF